MHANLLHCCSGYTTRRERKIWCFWRAGASHMTVTCCNLHVKNCVKNWVLRAAHVNYSKKVAGDFFPPAYSERSIIRGAPVSGRNMQRRSSFHERELHFKDRVHGVGLLRDCIWRCQSSFHSMFERRIHETVVTLDADIE